jgi:hypothetical protein
MTSLRFVLTVAPIATALALSGDPLLASTQPRDEGAPRSAAALRQAREPAPSSVLASRSLAVGSDASWSRPCFEPGARTVVDAHDGQLDDAKLDVHATETLPVDGGVAAAQQREETA